MLLVAEPKKASKCWKRLAAVMEACADARMPVMAMSSERGLSPIPLHEMIDGVPDIVRSILPVVKESDKAGLAM